MAGYAVTFSVVDQATAQINKINKSIAGLKAPLEAQQKALAKFADVTGLTKIANGFKSVASGAATAAEAMSSMVPAMGALVGAAALTGLAKLVSNFEALGDELTKTGMLLNETPERLYGVAQAMRFFSGNAQTAIDALSELKETMYDASLGAAPRAAYVFQRLGVAIVNNKKQYRDVIDVQKDFFAALDKQKNPMDVNRQLMIAGGKALADTYWQYKLNKVTLDEWYNKQKQMETLTAQQVKSMRNYEAAVGPLNAAFYQLGTTVATAVAPVFTELFGDLTNFVNAHQKDIKDMVEGWSKAFGDWLKSGDAKETAEDFKAVAGAIIAVVDALGKMLRFMTEHGDVIKAGLMALLPGGPLIYQGLKLKNWLAPSGGGGAGTAPAGPAPAGATPAPAGTPAPGGGGGGAPVPFTPPAGGGPYGYAPIAPRTAPTPTPAAGPGGGEVGSPLGPGAPAPAATPTPAAGTSGGLSFPAGWAPDPNAPQPVETAQTISHPERNNPGNLRVGPNAWEGKVTQPGAAFESFATMDQGIRARALTYASYLRRGVNTPLSIANTSGPASDNNDIASQVAAYRQALGGKYLQPGGENLPVDLTPENIRRLTIGGISIEAGGGGKWLPKGAGVKDINRVFMGMAAAGGGGAGGAASGIAGNYRGFVTDPKGELAGNVKQINADVIRNLNTASAALPPGWHAAIAVSPSHHTKGTYTGGAQSQVPLGMAADVTLIDPQGHALPEQVAHNAAEDAAIRASPLWAIRKRLADAYILASGGKGRWGGYYGLADTMQYGTVAPGYARGARAPAELYAAAASGAAGTMEGGRNRNGTIDVSIRHQNPPAGTTAIAYATGGGINLQPPRVEHQKMADVL